MAVDDERAGVALTNLDQPLFDGAEATKRDLVDYLDALADHVLPELRDRPLSVIRALRGQDPFMQKNLPKYAPDWIARTSVWSEASHRQVAYALGNDRATLLWFANQRAVEYHPALSRAGAQTHLVLDLDPPEGEPFAAVVAAAHLARRALIELGLTGAVKTSGAKGLHVMVPVLDEHPVPDVAAATRALAARAERLDPGAVTTAYIRADRAGKVFLDSTRAGGATVAACYSPRIRPGTPVSHPVPWAELDRIDPTAFTIRTVRERRPDRDAWPRLLGEPQRLPAELIAEGHQIPVARVQAMHEGRRRARARRG